MLPKKIDHNHLIIVVKFETYLVLAMLDSTTTPYLSLADETDSKDDSRFSGINKSFISNKKSTSSFVSAFEDTRMERLEKEVGLLSRKLEQEIVTRKRLQEMLTQSGINVPAELNTQE